MTPTREEVEADLVRRLRTKRPHGPGNMIVGMLLPEAADMVETLVAEAEAAQAALVERAAEICDAKYETWANNAKTHSYPPYEDLAGVAASLADALRALAPTAGVETLAKLREQIALSQALVEGALRKVEAAEAERDRLAAANAQLEARVAGLGEALERLGGMEAFTVPFMPKKQTPEWRELDARIDFARAALAAHGKEPT